MAEDAKKKEVKKEQPKADLSAIEERLARLEDKNNKLAEENNSLKSKNEEISSEFEELTSKLVSEDDEDDFDIKEYFKKKSKEEEEKLKNNKMKEFEEKQKALDKKLLVADAREYGSENPHLAPLINDLMSTNDVSSMDELKSKITPTMEEKYKEAYELEQRKKKAGGDPFADYGDSEISSDEKEKKEMQETIKELVDNPDGVAAAMRRKYNL